MFWDLLPTCGGLFSAEGILEILNDLKKWLVIGNSVRLYMEEFGSREKVIFKVEVIIQMEVVS